MRPLLAGLLANGVIPLAGDDEFLTREARSLSDELLGVDPVSSDFSFRLEQLASRMERFGSEHFAVREALLDLLRLVTANIRELVTDDSWLHEQLFVIAEEFPNPLSLRAIDAVGRQLREVIDKQSRLVSHDPLTGVLNHKGLIEALTREVSRTRRNGSPLCIALIGIDNFKGINDTYGHGIGDEALCHLACTVTETLRPQDVVARYGGEEFVILLPDTVPGAASSILKRLQHELACRVFYAHGSEFLPITFSAGIVLFSPEEEPETALSRADAAMYAAKHMGKNRVYTQA